MFDKITQMPQHQIETRWFSPENWDGSKGSAAQSRDGRKGSPCFPLANGESKILAHYNAGSGCIRRMWLTISQRSPETLRGLRMRCYWDSESKAAVDVPLGDFFGNCLGRNIQFESALNSNPEARSFNSCVPMPFKTGMKVELLNESGIDIDMVFFDINISINDLFDENTLYFHALWRRSITSFQEDYEFVPKFEGRGRFLGVNVGVIANTKDFNRTWWGEGECKCYIDGDTTLPTLCGTGTEDYIGTAWGQGQYDHLYQGCHLADGEHLQYAFYRWHIPDPIYFYNDLRITMHQIGHASVEALKTFKEQGKTLFDTISGKQEVDIDHRIETNQGTLFERYADDWSSCAFLYLDKPVNNFPELAAASERYAGLEIREDSRRLDQ